MSDPFFYALIFTACLIFPFLIWLLKYRSITEKVYSILTYHKVTNEFEWGITMVKPRNFEDQVKYLKENGFLDIQLDDLLKEEQKNDKLIAFTFDDGYESIYQNAFPLLKQYGFTATIFLITGYIGKENSWEAGFGRKFRHLNWEEIEEMRNAGFEFGSHTVNHPDLTKLDKKSLEYELRRSKETLEDKLNLDVKLLSYPFGRHNRLVRTEVEKAGYKAAFTLTSEKSFDPFAIGRIGVYLFDTPLSLQIKLSRNGIYWIEDFKGWVINQFSAGTVLVKKYKT